MAARMNVVSIKTGRAIDEMPSSPRVLLVTKHPFVPVHDGTSAVISLWYDCLRGMGVEVDVLSFDYVSSRWSDEGRAQLARDGVRLHIAAAYGRSGTSLRRLAVVAFAALFGHRFAPETLRTDRATRAKLDAVLSAPYELIVVHGVDAINLAGVARLRRHSAPKLLDIHDHFPFRILALQRTLLRLLRWRGTAARRHIARSDVLQAVCWPAPRFLTRAESRVASICDRILCSSDLEMAELRGAGVDPDRLVPMRWPILRPLRQEAAVRPAARYSFGFIGSGALFNVEGLLFFCRDIWPLIRARRPDATLLVAGKAGEACARMPERAREGVTIAGWMADVSDFYRDVDIVVVPLLSGTGVSVKTMEAAARGAAIVSTEAGLRGLTLRDRIEVRRADNAVDFAAAALSLLEDRAWAASLGASASEAMASHDVTVFRRFVEDLVLPLLNGVTLPLVSGRTA